jgi:hypothetical protein
MGMGVLLGRRSASRYSLSLIHDVMGFVAGDTNYANDPLTRPPCPSSLPGALPPYHASVQYPQRCAVDVVIER